MQLTINLPKIDRNFSHHY